MYDIDFLYEKILQQDRRALAKAITLIESKKPTHRKLADLLMEKVMPHSGKSFRIAISGVPGAGKSTFIENFGNYLTAKNKKVAVLTIDPSSSISGGSLLGDKTRMETLATNLNAFVRPSATAGTLGGIAKNTYESILLCEAAGYDIILIETVGVGQSETLAKNVSDFFLFLQVVGTGDELQGIKKGIMEMADLIFINKVDSVSKEKVHQTETDLRNALHYFPKKLSKQSVPVLSGSGLNNIGLALVWDECLRFQEATKENGFFNSNRYSQLQKRFQDIWNEDFMALIFSIPSLSEEFESIQRQIAETKISPYLASQKMVSILSSYLKVE